jgi:hypothetical protein
MLYDWCVLLKLIYIVDVVVISILLFLIVSTIILGKHYMDEAEGKGIVEKLYYAFYSFIALLFSAILILFLMMYICVRIYVSERADYFYTSLFAFKTLFSH